VSVNTNLHQDEDSLRLQLSEAERNLRMCGNMQKIQLKKIFFFLQLENVGICRETDNKT